MGPACKIRSNPGKEKSGGRRETWVVGRTAEFKLAVTVSVLACPFSFVVAHFCYADLIFNGKFGLRIRTTEQEKRGDH